MLWAVRAHLLAAVPGAKFNLVTFGLHSETLRSCVTSGPPPEARAAVALARTLFMESRHSYGATIDLPPSTQLSAAALQAAASSSEYALRLHDGRCVLRAVVVHNCCRKSMLSSFSHASRL